MGERQAQGQAAGSLIFSCYISQSHTLQRKPEIYYKTKNIFPNIIASSELIILCTQLREAFTESTSRLPTSYFMNHATVYSLCSTGHFCNSPASVSLPTFGFAHSNGVCHSSIQIPSLLSSRATANTHNHRCPTFHHILVHKTLFFILW